jgi:hypothetical protein
VHPRKVSHNEVIEAGKIAVPKIKSIIESVACFSSN